MPIYEYTCKRCDARFERLAKSMNEDEGSAKVACPQCRSTQTTRSMSVFAVSSAGASPKSTPAPGLCGRCGGPGPCAMG